MLVGTDELEGKLHGNSGDILPIGGGKHKVKSGGAGVTDGFSLFSSMGSFALESILYGIYIILFILAIRALTLRKQQDTSPSQRRTKTIHILAITTLFILTTLHVVLEFVLASKNLLLVAYLTLYTGVCTFEMEEVLHSKGVVAMLYMFKIAFVFSNFIADGIILHRCYVVWSGRTRIVILPAIIFAFTIVCGFGQFMDSDLGIHAAMAFLISSFLTNLVGTGLTAGRIWYKGATGFKTLSYDIRRQYTTAISILAESGIIYPAAILSTLIAVFVGSRVWIFPSIAIMYQAVAIAPTLIFVRIGAGTGAGTGGSDGTSSAQRYGRTPSDEEAAGSLLRHKESDSTIVAGKAPPKKNRSFLIE